MRFVQFTGAEGTMSAVVEFWELLGEGMDSKGISSNSFEGETSARCRRRCRPLVVWDRSCSAIINLFYATRQQARLLY